MVTSNRTWEEETRKYLTEVKAELINLEKQINELMGKRNSLMHEANAYETALQSRLKRTGKSEMTKSDWNEQLSKLNSTKERIKKIAEKSDGIIKVGTATDLLFNLGLIRSKSRANAYRVVYGLLQDMSDNGEFIKVDPGVFRMLDRQQALSANELFDTQNHQQLNASRIKILPIKEMNNIKKSSLNFYTPLRIIENKEPKNE